MSVVDLVRDAALDSKKKESATCVTSRKRKLRELYAYTSYVIHGIPKNHDFVADLPPGADESRFLDENDVVKGRYFAEATIPFPQNDSISQILPKFSRLSGPLQLSSSLAPSNTANATAGSDERHQQPVQATPDAEQPAVDAGEAEDHMAKVQKGVYQPLSEKLNESVSLRKSVQSPQKPVISQDAVEGDHRAGHLTVPPDEPGVNPSVAVPPAPEDLAALDAPVTPDADNDNKDRPAKVVHLPPKEVQERHLREIEHAQEYARRKEKKEDEKLGLSAEAASSPSSTLGTHSTFTPRPTQHSPDTSPDVETFPGGGRGSRPTDQSLPTKEHLMQEEHDRVLHSQMEEARAQARGNSPTPDTQLRLEEEQAIRATRDLQNFPELAPGGSQRNRSPLGPAVTEVAEQLATSSAQDDIPEKTLTGLHSEDTQVNSLPPHDGEIQTPGSPHADGMAVGSNKAKDTVMVKSENAFGMSNGHPVVSPRSSPLAGRGISHVTDINMPDAPTAASERPGLSHPPSEPSRSANTEPAIERRTTRVASGAIRQKSVSEILGGPSKISASQSEPRPTSAIVSKSASDADELLASTSGNELRAVDASERSHTSPIAVSSHGQNDIVELLLSASEDYAALRGASQDGKRDYLEPLYIFQAEQEPRATPLRSLIESSNKTLTTANQLASWRENQEFKILKRIYQLQNVNRWPLRQIEKSPEPPRPTTHLDHLLGQMKWARTDVTEERKWRTTAAHTMAAWCAEWVASDPQQRLRLQVKSKPQNRRSDGAQEQETKDKAPLDAGSEGEITPKTPDLIPSAANENDSDMYSEEHETPKDVNGSRVRTRLLSLGYDELVLKVDKTPASNDFFLKIPSYESLTYDFSAHEKSVQPDMEPPIVPVSKLVTGKVVCKPDKPPRKRSRYDYEDEEDGIAATSPRRRHSSGHPISMSPNLRSNRTEMPPEQTDVALFNPENKHVRDRLHASHAFRPPSEFPMPATSFFEARWSSQWLWEEDQKLRGLVKEYSYNWSLISDSLSLPSMFTSGAERRTPWECFERWVQLEGLPPDMSKTQYFRTYQSRLEAAQRTVLAQYQAAQQQMQQQAQTPGQVIPAALRRRTSQPIRVERRKNNRYLAIIDGMRKLARKRETAAHKQQEAAKAAALRKAHEAVQPKPNIHTPQEFSRIRHERDLKMQERQEQYRLHMNAQRNAAMQRAGQMPGQQQPLPAGVAQQPRNGTPNSSHGPSPLGNPPAQMGNPQAGVNGQARQHLQQPSLPNNVAGGAMGGMQMGAQGIPQAQMQQAQMQANMQGQARLQAHNTADLRMAMQQRAFNQQQQSMQQQHLNQPGNLAATHIGPSNTAMQNPAMLAAMAGQRVNGAANGMSSPAGNSVSPRMGQHNPAHTAQPQPLSSGHVPAVSQISHQIQAQNPSLSPDQVRRLTNEHLKGQVYQQSRQSALNAAAGASAAGPMNQMNQNSYQHNGNLPGSGSPTQHYQQQLRQRMLQQQPPQHMGSPGMNNGRPPSRSATPQGPPLQQVGNGSAMQDQHSPRPPQAQMNRNPA